VDTKPEDLSSSDSGKDASGSMSPPVQSEGVRAWLGGGVGWEGRGQGVLVSSSLMLLTRLGSNRGSPGGSLSPPIERGGGGEGGGVPAVEKGRGSSGFHLPQQRSSEGVGSSKSSKVLPAKPGMPLSDTPGASMPPIEPSPKQKDHPVDAIKPQPDGSSEPEVYAHSRRLWIEEGTGRGVRAGSRGAGGGGPRGLISDNGLGV